MSLPCTNKCLCVARTSDECWVDEYEFRQRVCTNSIRSQQLVIRIATNTNSWVKSTLLRVVLAAVECGMDMEQEMKHFIRHHEPEFANTFLWYLQQAGAHEMWFLPQYARGDYRFTFEQGQNDLFDVYKEGFLHVLSVEAVVYICLSYCCGDSYTDFHCKTRKKVFLW